MEKVVVSEKIKLSDEELETLKKATNIIGDLATTIYDEKAAGVNVEIESTVESIFDAIIANVKVIRG